MVRLSILSCTLVFFFLVVLVCSMGQEKQGDSAKQQTAEQKAVEFLKSKGGQLQRYDPNAIMQIGEPYWIVNFSYTTTVSDIDLMHLRQIKNLKYLGLG